MSDTRKQLLEDVGNCILQDRAAIHGSPEDNFTLIKQFWNVYLHRKYNIGYQIEDVDVAMMMALLKVARAVGNPNHMDNYIDGAGYLLLAGEQNAK